jgi:outer membrane receptor protein involved in Fe transport
MQSKIFTLLFLLFSSFALVAQTSVEGTVKDGESGETIIQCGILFFKNGVQVLTTVTDYDGNYNVQLEPGKYDIEARYVGYASSKITNVQVQGGKANKVNISLSKGIQLEIVEVTAYRAPLVTVDQTTQGTQVTAEQIKNLPTRDINAIAATAAGFSSVDGGEGSIRGSRTNATVYYLDGIRYTGRALPSSEIEQLQVVTGGIEAQYGDVTGGIIALTSKGPSAKVSGGIEAETSQYLDPYGYNLLSANISGPIWKKKSEGKADRTIIGYRLAGQYTFRKDDDPPAFGRYAATEDAIKRISDEPISFLKGNPYVTAQFLEDGKDVELLKYNPNQDNEALDLTGKLDIRPSRNIDVSLSGTYAKTSDRFVPTEDDETIGSGSWTLLNWINNPERLGSTYRANLRVKHRLGKLVDINAAPEEGEEAKKLSPIQNASYVLQLGYQNRKESTSDFRHGDQFFDYGYVGQFNVVYEPVFDIDRVLQGYIPLNRKYTPGTINPVWANYNKVPLSEQDALNIEAFRAFNSKVNTSFDNVWSGIHTNAGSVYDRYTKSDDDIYTLQATMGFDFLPFGSSKGRHNIAFGGMYEQRIDRGYTLQPYNLWETGRLLQNDLISGIDYTYFCGLTATGDTLWGGLYVPNEEAKFFHSVRNKIFKNNDEMNLHKYVHVDNLLPSEMSLDMFSAKELTDRSSVGYLGYDYLGNKLKGNVKFEDFFARDQNGIRNGQVAPNSPIYAAGFIQDKFTFKDIIFRLGSRIDYYDANTKVLKDKYSLYGIMGAKTFHDRFGTAKPGTIGDDFKVYTTSQNGNIVKAYRSGDNWYFPNGNLANSAISIFQESNLVNPRYNVDADSLRTIRGKDFKVDDSFEDYKPQVNIMPRLAFSFPISEDANFFAHYDVLVQRPTSNSFVSPLDYLYWDLSGRTPANNGSLKPSKTIDYEVGFQQKISNSSAVKISAYYKELRDDIQRTTISKVASVGTYNTYGNLDFGTVKGFNFTYDFRRTNNFEFNAAYTLQFADGTGSDAETQRGLTEKGINIRNIFPFTYDERHRISFVGDYRYDSGKRYNGPRVMGKDILSNTGLNIQLSTASGRPYSPGTTIVRYDGTGYRGSINGARLPWNFNVDAKADKSFNLTKADAKHPLSLNLYCRVQNLLNTKNVIGVYRGSGGANDDGYLSTALGTNEKRTVTEIYGANSLDFFVDSYNWRLLNPNNYTQPRRIIVGAILEF